MAVDPWIDKIRRACVYLSNVDGHPALATLAARLGGSPYHLQRNFKRLVGVSPREYAEACRLGKVKRGLRQPGDITAAMFDAGYGSSSRFYERAVPKLGMAPSVYRRGGAGMSVQYTIVDSSNDALGRLLVAATPRGVCAVAMGASDADLTRPFARVSIGGPSPPTAASSPDRPTPSSRILPGGGRAWICRSSTGDRVPVAGMAGACAIPYGERKRTYSEVAASIGRPRAVGPWRVPARPTGAALASMSSGSAAAGGTGGYRGAPLEESVALDRASGLRLLRR